MKNKNELPKKRMTGIEYRREWNLIQQSEKSLKAHVRERLMELIKIYPETVIPVITIVVEKRKCKDLTEDWLANLSTYGMIGYIEKIEEFSADQQGSKQLTIDKIYKDAKDTMGDTLKKLDD